MVVYYLCAWCVWPVRQHSSSMTCIKRFEIVFFLSSGHWYFFLFWSCQVQQARVGHNYNRRRTKSLKSGGRSQLLQTCPIRTPLQWEDSSHWYWDSSFCCCYRWNCGNSSRNAPHLHGFHHFKLDFCSLEMGQCFTFGSNQHGQIGCSSRRNSRVPYQVPDLQGITMAACGDAFTLAIGSGELGVLMLTNRMND